MNKPMAKAFRRAMALCCAGMMFQTAGCMTGTNELVAGLAVSVVNSLVSSLVFGAFNLTP